MKSESPEPSKELATETPAPEPVTEAPAVAENAVSNVVATEDGRRVRVRGGSDSYVLFVLGREASRSQVECLGGGGGGAKKKLFSVYLARLAS